MSLHQTLVDVALGRVPAELVIQGGTLVNTGTAELLPGWGVAVHGGRIAAVGDVRRCIGPATPACMWRPASSTRTTTLKAPA